jgi:serine/threonine protein kinase
MIGSKLGPYELLEEIGHGGMATVYRAYQPSMDRYVAIKVIRNAIRQDSKSLDRFTREAKLVAKLEHPHILPVHDYDATNDPPYIVMRYLPTGTLKDIMERAKLSFSEVIFLMSQVSSALDYAHRQGVVHRDIKPSNIMVDSDGNAFLTDFGIARIIEAAEGLTASGAAIGTPGYMAPEQGIGNPVDSRADIYALGVMLFEMLSGKMPFSAETPMGVILKHINDPVPQITLQNPDLPSGINAILQKAMAKNPNDRYATASELSRALSSSLGVTAEASSPDLRQIAQETNLSIEQARQERSPQPPTAPLKPVPVATVPVPLANAQPTSARSAGPVTPAMPRPDTGTGQSVPQAAVNGGIIGALVAIVLLLLIGGGVFLFLGSRNTTDVNPTLTMLAQTQVAFAFQTTQNAAATLTATNLVKPTEKPSATSTVVPATLLPTTVPPTIISPTLVAAATTSVLLPPTAAPISSTALPTVALVASTMKCDGFNKPSRLNVGMQGRVLPDQDNIVNSKPARPSLDPSSENVGTIPAGGQFQIVDGPVCAESIIWWQVTYRAVRGWTGEGEGVNYWVEPVTGQ